MKIKNFLFMLFVFAILSTMALFSVVNAGINDRFSGIDLEEDNYISLPELRYEPSNTPPLGFLWFYAKDGNVYSKNDQGVNTNTSPGAGIQDVPAGGTSTVLVLTNSVFTVGADAGGDIVTLANGSPGQIAYIVCEDATGVTTITPATFNGGTSITFNALGEAVTLLYTAGTGWSIVGGNAYTVI